MSPWPSSVTSTDKERVSAMTAYIHIPWQTDQKSEPFWFPDSSSCQLWARDRLFTRLDAWRRVPHITHGHVSWGHVLHPESGFHIRRQTDARTHVLMSFSVLIPWLVEHEENASTWGEKMSFCCSCDEEANIITNWMHPQKDRLFVWREQRNSRIDPSSQKPDLRKRPSTSRAKKRRTQFSLLSFTACDFSCWFFEAERKVMAATFGLRFLLEEKSIPMWITVCVAFPPKWLMYHLCWCLWWQAVFFWRQKMVRRHRTHPQPSEESLKSSSSSTCSPPENPCQWFNGRTINYWLENNSQRSQWVILTRQE